MTDKTLHLQNAVMRRLNDLKKAIERAHEEYLKIPSCQRQALDAFAKCEATRPSGVHSDRWGIS